MAPPADWRFSVIDGDLDAGCTLSLKSVIDPPARDDQSNNSKVAAGTVKFGSEGKVDTVKYEGSDAEGKIQIYKGPSAGIDFGVILTEEEKRFAAMTEVSAASATFPAGTLNFNANTGVKVGNDGVKFALFGFGATMGYKGVYSIDTPLGSIHSQTSSPLTNSHTYATR